VDNKLNEFLQLLIDTLKGSKEFVISQAPDIVQEIILRGKCYSIIGAVCFVLGLILLPRAVKSLQNEISQDKDPTVGSMLRIASITVLAAMIFFGFIDTCMHWTVWITPKLYVIETLAAMIKAQG
jgi:hypothetical protein